MEIQMSLSAKSGNVHTLSASEITKLARALLPKVKFNGNVDDPRKDNAINRIMDGWVSGKSTDYPAAQRLLIKSQVSKRLVGLINKAGGAKAALAQKPVKKSMGPTPDTVKSRAELMAEKQKSVLKVANKLRDRFAGFLTKPPAMTAKGIIDLRAQCAAFQKVINSVEKGNEGLAEATKIEGLRGLPALKNYVNSVLGLSYGYHELVRMLGVKQGILGEKIREEINVESMTKVMQKQRAKENAQNNLSYAVKALQRRGCMLPPAFVREVEKVFVDGVQDGDYKAAKARIKELLDGLVSDVFNNKVKLFQIK